MMMRVRWGIAGLLVCLLGGALASEGQTLLFRVDDPRRQALAHFGLALAGVGDIDGDGVPDLAAGAPYQNVAGQGDQGQVFLFSGATGARLRTLNDPVPQAGAYFGLALAGGGDIDGDGVPDVAVGAPGQEVAGQAGQGQVFVFSGASGQLVLTLTKPSPQAQAGFGWTLAGVGDVDGDGIPDLAVGAPYQDVYDRQDQECVVEPGRAFVFSLGATP
jgi:hypothetical protein